MYFDDDSEYRGAIRNGEPHGQGTKTWPDGSKYVGGWSEGFFHGQGTLNDREEGFIAEGNW